MAYIKKADRRKNQYQKVSFDFKLSVIDEIHNGLISINHAAKVYNISRSSITYWMQKLSSFAQNKKGMSKDDVIKSKRNELKRWSLSKTSNRILLLTLKK